MLLDDALSKLGNPGRYHVLVYTILCSTNAYVAFHQVALPSVYGITPPFSCVTAPSSGVTPPSSDKNDTNSLYSVFDCEGFVNNSHGELKKVKCSKWKFSNTHGNVETLVTQWNLVCDKKSYTSLANSGYYVGIMIGSMLGGMLSDRIGRRSTLIGCLALVSCLSTGIVLSPNIIVFGVMRFFIGFFVSNVGNIVIIYMTEISRDKYKEFGLIGQINMFQIGNLSGVLVAWSIKRWRYFQLALSLPGFLFLIVIIGFIPESFRWLMAHDKEEQMKAILHRAARFNGVTLDKDLKLDDVTTPRKNYTLFDVFRTPEIRRRSCIVIFIWFSSGIAYFGLNLGMRSLSTNPFLAILMSGCIDLPLFVLAWFYLRRFGKRRTITVLLVSGGIFCVMYKIYNHIAIVLIGKMMLSVSFGIVTIYIPELYPTVIRNIGVGTCSLIARLGSVLGPQTVVLGLYTSVDIPILIMGCFTIVAGLLTLLLPETLNVPLFDTIEDLEEDRIIRKQKKREKKQKGKPVDANDFVSNTQADANDVVSNTQADANDVVSNTHAWDTNEPSTIDTQL